MKRLSHFFLKPAVFCLFALYASGCSTWMNAPERPEVIPRRSLGLGATAGLSPNIQALKSNTGQTNKVESGITGFINLNYGILENAEIALSAAYAISGVSVFPRFRFQWYKKPGSIFVSTASAGMFFETLSNYDIAPFPVGPGNIVNFNYTTFGLALSNSFGMKLTETFQTYAGPRLIWMTSAAQFNATPGLLSMPGQFTGLLYGGYLGMNTRFKDRILPDMILDLQASFMAMPHSLKTKLSTPIMGFAPGVTFSVHWELK